MNQKIVDALVRAMNRRVPDLPTTPGWCLMFARLVVENAMGWRNGGFYDRYLVTGTSRRPGTHEERLRAAHASKWAADIEASMKRLGLAVHPVLRKPGDLVFDHTAAAPVGHVGVLLSRDWVVENINPTYRPGSIHLPNSISITPYKSRPWTLVSRLK